MEYIFLPDNPADPQSVADLVESLRQNQWRGAIVGPHGTGKSTLLAALAPELQAAARSPSVITLHNNQRRLPWSEVHSALKGGADLLIVDGYEQLSVMQRWKLDRLCRRQDLGLLITCHAPVKGLPTLLHTQANARTAEAVLRIMLANERELLPTSVRRSKELLPRQNGNLREVLFALYDEFETGKLQKAALEYDQSRDDSHA